MSPSAIGGSSLPRSARARRPGTRRAGPGRGTSGCGSPSCARGRAYVACRAGERLRSAWRSIVMPTRAPGASRRRISAARPCASRTWCAAASASALAASPGRVLPEAVAEPRDHPRLVLRDPVRDAVAEARGHGLRVLGERADGARATASRRGPRAPAGRSQWYSVDERLDAVGEQLVDEAVVEVEPGRVDADRGPPGGCAATRSRSGRRRGRARASGATSSR